MQRIINRIRDLLQPCPRPFTRSAWFAISFWTGGFLLLFYLAFPALGQQAATFGLAYIGFVAWFYGTRFSLFAFIICTGAYSTRFGQASETGNMVGMLLGLGISLSVSGVSRLYAKLQETEAKLREEHEKSEMILGNIFPRRIVERLKNGEVMIADRYLETTLLFSDLVGFTDLTRFMSPAELVRLLDKLITGFDQLSERLHTEKIKTIGDAYLVVSGMPDENANHAIDICHMALAMQRFVREFNQSEGLSLQIRIGMNSGPVIGGVIGPKKFTFDLWGDTVNMASRLETTGVPDRIQVSQSTWELARNQFLFETRPPIEIKGFGLTQTYFLLGAIEQE